MDWPLVAYSGGVGIATAGVVALTARATDGADELVRLVVVLGAAVLTLGLAVDRAEQSLRTVGAAATRAAVRLQRPPRS